MLDTYKKKSELLSDLRLKYITQKNECVNITNEFSNLKFDQKLFQFVKISKKRKEMESTKKMR